MRTIPTTANGRRRSVDTFLPARHDRAALQEVTMLSRVGLTLVTVFTIAAAVPCIAQDETPTESSTAHTTRPMITGRHYGVSSMKHQATEAAVRILQAGGNAFDAAVAGQAVLALVAVIVDARTGTVSAGADPRVYAYAWAR
jgi:hypothetical protein